MFEELVQAFLLFVNPMLMQMHDDIFA